MAVNTREYHRTFNILRLSGRMPSGPELARNLGREFAEAKAKYPRFPDHQALDLLRADKLRSQKPLAVHDALEDTGSQYRTARIEAKSDQNFEKFATRWELVWSRLVMYHHSRLTPVVDNSGMVVAYIGDVNPEHFLIDLATHPDPYTTLTADTTIKSVEILKNYRLFVGTNEFYGRKDLSIFGSNLKTRHTVVTDIHGEVMSYEIGAMKNHAMTPVSLLDIAGTLTLARTALGLVVSLGKTGVRTLTRRPPKPLTTMGAEETLTGIAVSRGSRLPAKHLNQRSIIADADMAELDGIFTLYAKRTPGIYDILIHGNQKTFSILVKGPNGQTVAKAVSARDVADAVRPYLKPGDQIRLVACEVGKGGGGPAQELADLLKRTVWAPTHEVFPRMGKMMINKKTGEQYFTRRQSFVPLGTGHFKPFSPAQADSAFPPMQLPGTPD
jgi:hypothetical protein